MTRFPRWFCLVGLIVLVVWMPAALTRAQAASSPASGIEKSADSERATQASGEIRLENVPDRALATLAELETLRPSEASRRTLERIESELDGALQTAESNLSGGRQGLAAAQNVRGLQTAQADLDDGLKRLQPLDDELAKQLDEFRGALPRLDAIGTDWEAVAKLGHRSRSSSEILTQIATVHLEIDKVRSEILNRRERVLAARNRLLGPIIALASALDEVQNAIFARLEGIFRVDRLPLWSAQVRESLRDEWENGGAEQFLQRVEEGGRYAGMQGRMLGFQLVLFVVFGLGLRSLRDHAETWAEDDYSLRDAKEVFGLPWAMALMATLLLTTPLHPLAPRVGGFVSSALISVAILRIGLRFLVPSMSPLAWGLILVFIVDRARDLLDATPGLERVAFLVEALGALGLLVWLLRPSQVSKIPTELRDAPVLRLLGAAMRVAAVALVFSIAADLAGWGDLAGLVGNSTLRGGYTGYFVFVLFMVSQSLVAFALVFWPLRQLRSVSRHRMLVRRRLKQVLTVLAIGFWLTLMFSRLGLLDPARASVERVLGASVSVGALSLSLGEVMAFALTLWLSFLLARGVDFILKEDVFTRVQAGRGVPYAIAGLVRYALIFVGFLVALSAAGVEVSQLTVVAGGLGVGIGFGLQGVVSNFVSGLILLFERPIQVGDTIQLPDVWGSVKRIGIRASVIRTFDGADVVVPNGMLVSEKVTNWTLSDNRRRVEVNVGVQYGTPAQRVIDLLVAVAEANSKVLSDPVPRAFFINFGDSALEFNLRVWIDTSDDGFAVRSDLGVAIQRALDDAAISVPFPQRDLHLVSVNPEVALGSNQIDPAQREPS